MIVPILLGTSVLGANALAAPIMCSSGSANYTHNGVSATVTTSDVSTTNFATNPASSINSTDCFYDPAPGNPFNPDAEQAIVNATDWVTVPTFGSGDFTYAAKEDIGGL